MDDTTPSPPRSRFRRRALITAACLLAGLLLAASVGWYYRLALAERAIVAALATQGIAPASLTVDRLSLRSASASAISLGSDQAQKIGRIDVTYSLDALRRGEITGIHVDSLRLDGRLVDGRLELPGLNALFEAESSGDAMPLRVATLTADDFHLALATPHGDLALTGDATAATSAEGLIDIAATWSADAVDSLNSFNANGSAAATLLPTGEVIGRVTLDDGNARIAEDGVEGLHGDAQILGHGDNYSIDATISGDRIRLRGNTVENAVLTAGLTFGESGIRVDTRLDAAEGHAALAGTVQPAPDGGFAYDGSIAAGLDLPNIAARLSGTLHATAPEPGKIAGQLEITDAALALSDIGFEAAGVSGQASFTKPASGLPDITAAIDFQRLTYAGFDADRTALTLVRNAERTTFDADFSSANGDNVSIRARHAPDRLLTFHTNGVVAPGPILDALAGGTQTSGEIGFDVSGSLTDPWGPLETMPDRLTVEGDLTPDLKRLQIPGVLRDGSLKGPLRVLAEPGNWVFSSPSFMLSNVRFTPELLQSLPSTSRQHTQSPVTVELRAAGESHATLRITPRDGGYAAAFSGTARTASRSVALTITGQADATLPFSVAGGSGKFHLAGTHTESIVDGGDPVTIRPDVNGTFTLTENILTARTGAASQVKVDSVILPDRFRTTAPLLMTIEQPFNFRADFGGGQPVDLSYDGVVTLRNSRFAITAGQEPTDLILSDIPVRIEGGTNRLTVEVGPAQAELPDHAIHADGIAVKLAAADNVRVDLDIGDIRQRTPDPVIVPLQLQASAESTNGLARFSAHLHDKPERISIRATGEHDLAHAKGSATVTSTRIIFLPTVLQPADLFPVVGNQLQETDGYFESNASLQWQDSTIESRAEFLVNITTLETDEVQLENAATLVTFDSLFPLSTPPGQEIHVGVLDIGIPLTGGRIEFQMAREGHITTALRELDLFGGRIETDPFTVPAKLDGFTIPLEVSGVRLDSLLAATKVGDLTATGTLDGQIPVVFEDGRVFVRNGVLESTAGGGIIQYRPEGVGPALSDANEGTALFLDIVRNFQYDSVRVTIDEQATGDIPFEFKIKGKNPAVYKGIPVELNLSMSGPLRAILQQGLKTYTLPDRLLERMEDFHNQ